MYYKSKNFDVPILNKDYKFVCSIDHLYELLLCVWSKETCAPRMRKDWSKDNPTLGQCSVTAFLIQDIFGGEVYGVPLSEGGFHCFNFISGTIFDLTNEQFGNVKLNYTLSYPQSRDIHFADLEKLNRYQLLKENFIKTSKN